MKSWRVIYWPEASPTDYIVTRPLVNDLRAEGKVPDTFLSTWPFPCREKRGERE
jgi:hypothetical protein